MVSKRILSDKLSSFDDALADNALEVFVSRLRKKLAGTGVECPHAARPGLSRRESAPRAAVTASPLQVEPASPRSSIRTRMAWRVLLPLALIWLIGSVTAFTVANVFTLEAFDRSLVGEMRA